MGSGTPAMGKKNKNKTHIVCRRCGHKTFNVREKRCSHCGFPAPRLRHYAWAKRK